ncbi:uncharacterized protein (DUF1810 family) [Larkinella arboricola]|uniref:Uncharacterized protein (DUF1810 family) n=1 Tax=Larkinella arboricola TaxID=643671 RepID=A0A327WPI4_LARAB|nr:DUF1810 domain-containing protein [Larkinella arboricola]RAJ93128.1 uncharacterized protein (DUF1810 family) [Larkinella arboricola]
METESHLERFINAQQTDYFRALTEIRNGRKESHWMWYIFPQIRGLGFSETARFYAIHDLKEAGDYLAHPVLGKRLIEISSALLAIEGKTAHQILGSPDDLKLRSSMTLFSLLENTDPVFQAVLDKFFNGLPDQRTVELAGATK